jgi:hypothetical protein
MQNDSKEAKTVVAATNVPTRQYVIRPFSPACTDVPISVKFSADTHQVNDVKAVSQLLQAPHELVGLKVMDGQGSTLPWTNIF